MINSIEGGKRETRPAYRVGSVRSVTSSVLSNGCVVITDAAHPAVVGDFLKFQTGGLDNLEFPVIAVATNTITIGGNVLPANADQFFVMRYTTTRVDENGDISVSTTQGPTQYVLNGVDTQVEEVTATPANSRPLPVKWLSGVGAEITQPLTDPQLRATPVPVSGPLTDTQLRASPVPVSAATLPLPTGAAAESTLSAMSAKLPATLGQKTGANSMAVVPASDYTPPASSVPTAITVKQAAITVGTSAVRLTTDGSAPSATRRYLLAVVDPASAATFYIGSSSVTNSGATRGAPLVSGGYFERENDAGDYYIISSVAAQTLFITEQE